MIAQVLVQRSTNLLNHKTMKTRSLLCFLVVVFLTTNLTAQDTKIWFDSNWSLTTKEKAIYYRPAPKKINNRFWIVDYYMDGTIQMEGHSLTNIVDKEKFDGLVKYYFENGILNQEIFYKAGVVFGGRKIYYPSGKLKNKRTYRYGKIEGTFIEYYETGEILEKGDYKHNLREGRWRVLNKDGTTKEKGNYRRGKKKGMWKVFY